jgi:hypothetical protein
MHWHVGAVATWNAAIYITSEDEPLDSVVQTYGYLDAAQAV